MNTNSFSIVIAILLTIALLFSLVRIIIDVSVFLKKYKTQKEQKEKNTFIEPNDNEIDVLEKIARASKMDCWFHVQALAPNDDNRKHAVYDLEEHKTLSWNEAIETLYEGMTSILDYSLTDAEIITFVKLLDKEFTS